MTKRLSYFKRLVSVALAVVMCLSVCVLDWSGLGFDASAATAGKYDVKVVINVSNTMYCKDTQNVHLYTKANNGTASSETDNGSLSFSTYNDSTITKEWSSVGFPSRITCYCAGSTLVNAKVVYTVTVSVKPAGSGSYTAVQTSSSYSHSSDLTATVGSFTDTFNVTSNKPYANSISYSTSSGLSVTVPTSGTATVGSGTATVYDQYGVAWYQAPQWTVHSTSAAQTNRNDNQVSGISVSSTGNADSVYVQVTNDAKGWVSNNSDGSTYQKTVYVNAFLGNLKTGSRTVTVTNCKYNLDLNGYVSSTYSGGSYTYASAGNISPYGTASVTYKASSSSTTDSNVTDFYTACYYGTSYSITNIAAATGYTYEGVYSGSVSGKITGDMSVYLKFRKNHSKLTVNPNSGSWNGSTSSTTSDQLYNSTLSVPLPTKSGWTFTGWTKSSTFYGTLSSTTAAATYTFPTNDNVTSTITAGWKRDITNTYHYYKADAATDQTKTSSGTAYNTATTLALTSPASSAVVTEVAKNDKTWTLKGWNEQSSVTWGGATATANVGFGASHNVATTSSAHTFMPVYALKTTKYYANYNYYLDEATAFSKVQKNTTVNGDATSGAMPVPSVSDNGANAEIPRYFTKNGIVYELKGWSTTNNTLGSGTAAISYNASTGTVAVPGAGTPSSTANLTAVELYPVYSRYATAIHVHFNYYDASGNNQYLDVSGRAVGDATSGTVSFPDASQVVTQYTKNGRTYTLVGWNLTENSETYTAFNGTATHNVLANPATDYYTYYPVYKTVTNARYHYFTAAGNVKTDNVVVKAGENLGTTSGNITGKSASIAVAKTAELTTTYTMYGRTYTLKGWAAKNVSGTGAYAPDTQATALAKTALGTGDVAIGAANLTLKVTDNGAAYEYYPVYELTETVYDVKFAYTTGTDTLTTAYATAQATAAGYNTTGTVTAPANVDVPTYKQAGLTYVITGWKYNGTNYAKGSSMTVSVESESATGTHGTPTRAATYTCSEPTYDLYQKDLYLQFYYYNANGESRHYDVTVANKPVADTTATVTMTAASNVVTSYTKDGKNYILRGWAKTNSATDYKEFGSNMTVNLNARATTTIHLYPVYECVTTARYYYYDANGTQQSLTKTASFLKTDSSVSANENIDVVVPTNGFNTTITLDGRQFNWCGWRKDTTSAAQTVGKISSENHAVSSTEYKYYAIYSNNDLTLSYNGTLRGLTASPIPEAQTATQYINAGSGASANINNATSKTFNIFKDDVTPLKTGYTFIGWDTTNAETESAAYKKTGTTSITVKVNTTVYARFSVNSMNVTFVYYKNGLEDAFGSTVKTVSYDDLTRADTATATRYVVTAPVVKIVGSDNVVNASNIAHADNTNHYVFKNWVRSDGKGVHNSTTSGISYTAKFKNVTENITIQAIYSAYAHHYVALDDAALATVAEKYNPDHDTSAYLEPTCTEEGYQYVKCTDCGHVYKQPIANLYHVDSEGNSAVSFIGYKPATCENTGVYAHGECELCGYEVKDEENNIVYFDYDSATGTYEAVESDDGIIPATGHNYEFSRTVAPTCTDKGYDLWVCTNNSLHTDKRNPVDANGHTESITPAVAATCTTDGRTEKIVCSVCTSVIIDSYIVPAAGHTLTRHAAKAATCTEAGNIEYYECTVCGKLFTSRNAEPDSEVELDDTVLGALEHDFVETEAAPATCTTDGHTAGIVCSRCGAVAEGSTAVTTETVLGHDWDEGVHTDSAIPCLEPGYTTYTCQREDCGFTKIVYDDIAEHDSFEVEGTPATCTAMGKSSHLECSVCHKVLSNYKWLPMKDHDYSVLLDEGTPATCTEDGIAPTYKCANCDETIGGEAIEATGCSWTEWIPVKFATCTENGSEIRYCKNCGAEETRDILTTGHDYAEVAEKAATCTEAGYTAGVMCKVCGDIQSGCTEIEATDHDYGSEPAEIQEATCIFEGTAKYVCVNCGFVDYRPIEKKAHDYQTVAAVEATCTSTGLTEGSKCSVCGDVETAQQETAKKDHNAVTVLEISATCTNAGRSSYKYCEVCGAIITNSFAIPAKGHTWGEYTITPANCTNNGSKTRVCTECGIYDEPITLTSAGHNAVTVPAVPATCNEDGKTSYQYCSICNEIIGEGWSPVEKLGHEYVATVTEPTCVKDGYTTYRCSRCGDSYKTDETAALGHTGGTATCKDKAVCTRCHKEYGSYAEHKYTVTETFDGTCNQRSYVVEKCSVCDASKKTNGAYGEHQWTVTSVSRPATCVSEGISVETCATCSQVRNAVIPATGVHADENNDGYCDSCGMKLSSSTEEGEGSGSGSTAEICHCGMRHSTVGGIFGRDGIFCRILTFFRNLFKIK